MYIDDFLVVANSRAECQLIADELVSLLRHLGLKISWKKFIDPTQCITFLGVEIDSVDMCLRVLDCKLKALKQLLEDTVRLKMVTRRQLESLAGKLSWMATLIRGGRAYLRDIFVAVHQLKHKRSRLVISINIREDLSWWLTCMNSHNDKSLFLDRLPVTCAHTDGCVEGAGAVTMTGCTVTGRGTGLFVRTYT